MKKKFMGIGCMMTAALIMIQMPVQSTAAEVDGEEFIIDAGNDPNNIYQSQDCLAFDEEYIYYSANNLIKRCRKDGTETVYIGNGSGFLNVYGDYLYYALEEDEYARINRINLTSFETEQVYEVAGAKYEDPVFSFLLAAEGYLIYGVSNSMADYTRIGAVDLETMYTYTLFSCNDNGNLGIDISVTDDAVYAFIEDDEAFSSEYRQTWKVNFSDIRAGSQLKLVADTSYFGLHDTMILLNEGICRCAYSSIFEEDMHYYKAEYENISEEECRWGFVSDESRRGSDLLKIPEEQQIMVYYGGYERFMIGDAMFIMKQQEDYAVEIFRYENFDFNDSQYIGRVAMPDYYTLLCGKSGDCIYLVETTEEEENLICIEADGTMSTTPIVMAEQQNENVDAYLETKSDDDYTYKLYVNEVKILSYLGDESNIEVPAEIEGRTVTEIGGKAFHGNENIKSVIIPEPVNRIGQNAFSECDLLESVKIQGESTQLGAYAFYHCDNLAEVILSEGVAEIGEGVFQECFSLSEIIIPDSVKTIGDKAFYRCSALTSLELGEGVQTIGEFAFYYTDIQKLVIPDSVTSVGESACLGCRELVTASVGDGLSVIPEGMFGTCEKLEEVSIGTGVLDIMPGAFSYCLALEEIMIPDQIQHIDASGMDDTGLKRISGSRDSLADELADYLGIDFAETSYTASVSSDADEPYLLASSSDTLLTDADIAGLDYNTLVYARYEILARKGVIFEDETVNEYFNQKDWYLGFINEEEFADGMLNEYEEANIAFLEDAIAKSQAPASQPEAVPEEQSDPVPAASAPSAADPEVPYYDESGQMAH